MRMLVREPARWPTFKEAAAATAAAVWHQSMPVAYCVCFLFLLRCLPAALIKGVAVLQGRVAGSRWTVLPCLSLRVHHLHQTSTDSWLCWPTGMNNIDLFPVCNHISSLKSLMPGDYKQIFAHTVRTDCSPLPPPPTTQHLM